MSKKSTLVVLITVVLNMTGVGLFWPILPGLVAEISGGTISQTAVIVGLLAVSFSVMQFIFAPFLGAASDRFGRRPVMLVALAGLGLDTLFLAFAYTIPMLFIGRILGGIFGATFSVANAYMADISSDKDRAAAFGKIGAAFGIGFIIGPLIGGALGEIDLRLPFYCAAALSFINVIFGYFFLEESLSPEKRKVRPLKKMNPFSALSWLMTTPVVASLALALLFANMIQRGLEAIWVLFTEAQYGWGPKEAGLSLAVVGISFVIVQGFLVKRVVNHFGEVATIVGGFTLSAVMYLMLAFNEVGAIAYLGIIPHVLGWGVAGPALQAVVSKQVGPSAQGLAQGGLTAISGLAAILGPAFSTASFAYFTRETALFYFPGAYFFAGAFVLLLAAFLGLLAGKSARLGKDNGSK